MLTILMRGDHLAEQMLNSYPIRRFASDTAELWSGAFNHRSPSHRWIHSKKTQENASPQSLCKRFLSATDISPPYLMGTVPVLSSWGNSSDSFNKTQTMQQIRLVRWDIISRDARQHWERNGETSERRKAKLILKTPRWLQHKLFLFGGKKYKMSSSVRRRKTSALTLTHHAI